MSDLLEPVDIDQAAAVGPGEVALLQIETIDGLLPPEDEIPSAVSSVVKALAVIAVVFLALLAVIYYAVQRKKPAHHGGKNGGARRQHKRVQNMVWYVLAIVVVMAVSTLLGIIGLTVIHTLERSKLFVPTRLSRYRKAAGKWYPLPGGGGLLDCTPDIDPRARVCVLFHGNSFSIDSYWLALERFAQSGYHLYALEYSGFGMTDEVPGGITGETILRDLRECWAICGREDAIIVGFSLGGAALGQVYDELVPMPAQLVFLNTFYSVPALIEDKVGAFGPWLSPLLETQWVTKEPRNYSGRVVIVFSNDDTVVPPEHSAELCAIFSSLNPTCIELPKGGHRWSSFSYMSAWCNDSILLPP